MSQTEIVVAGTLKPDGTLELDHKPNLSPGRVTVVLRPVQELPAGDPFFDMLKGIWAARAQAGLAPRSVEEVEAERRRWRDQSGEEVADAGRLQAECQDARNAASPPDRESE